MHSTSSKGFNHRDSGQRHPLMSWEEKLFLAVNRGDARSVKTLLTKGVSVNEIHSSGRTPLGLAAQLGNIEILSILLETVIRSNPKSSEEKCLKDLLEAEYWCEGTSFSDRKAVCPDEKNKFMKSPNSLKYKSNSYFSKFRCDSVSSDDETPDSDIKNQRNNRRYRNKTKNEPGVDHVVKSVVRCDSFEKNVCYQLPSECQENCYSMSDYKSEKFKNKVEPNQGYFIVVHKEATSKANMIEDEAENVNCNDTYNEPKTPDDMDNLEWDCELHHQEYESKLEDSEEADSWIDLYRWYADYLAQTCPVDIPVKQNPSCRIDVNQLDMYRRTAMHYAAEQGNMEVLQLLINAGCSVDIGDADDVTPLHLASARDYPDAVSFLVSHGAKVNRKTIDGTGPLHMAAARGFMETAGILLEHGANVNALDRSDRTPLLLAVSRGLQDMVQLLISHRAKVNVEDILGYTPLCQAVWQQEKEIVHLLLSAGAKLTHSDRLLHCAILHRCTDIAELLITAGSIINLRDDNGDTPLIIAARSGQTDMVNLLLHSGAMANYPNGLTGSTPLHEAVECLRSSQYKLFKEILFSLLNHHGPVGLLNIESASSYDTPLARALVHNKDRMMILLIQYGADVSLLQQHTPVVSETYLQKRPNRWIIAQLMVFAGLDLWKHTPTIKMDINYPDDSPASWIATLKCNPMSLSALCRLKFRRLFGENLHKAVYRSGLPPLLRKFILLEDIVNADDFLCPST